MITDDRRSQIDGRKESCFHIIADDRERSQSRLQCLHFSQQKCQNYRRFVLTGKLHQNNMARRASRRKFWRKQIYFFFYALSDVIVRFKTAKTSVLGSQNILEETRTSTLSSKNFVFPTKSTSNPVSRRSWVRIPLKP